MAAAVVAAAVVGKGTQVVPGRLAVVAAVVAAGVPQVSAQWGDNHAAASAGGWGGCMKGHKGAAAAVGARVSAVGAARAAAVLAAHISDGKGC